MKYLSRLLAGAILVGLTACSSDEPVTGAGPATDEGNGEKSPFYTTISFKMPGARSGAVNEGEEVGLDRENKVGSILVVLATKPDGETDYKYLTCAMNDNPVPSSDKTDYTITFQDKTKLFAQAGKDVYVFAYCNPTDKLRDAIVGTLNPTTGKYEGGLENPAVGATPTTTFKDIICGTNGDNADVASTWRDNAFLMTSVKLHKIALPDEDVLKTYDSETNPFNLCEVGGSVTPIEVIRTASRFDIRDVTATNDWTYEIEDPASLTTPKAKAGKVKLNRVALFNLRNNFYYLPRVKTKGVETINLCPGMAGMEFGVGEGGAITSEVFVISPESGSYDFANPVKITPLDVENATDDAYAKLAGLEWTSLASLSEEDNDNTWNDPADPNRQGYKIWRYATENTFPETTTDIPANQATGVVFEAEIIPNEGFGNKEGETYHTMYLYDGILYANASKMKGAIEQNPSSTLSAAFAACFDVNETTGAVTPKADVDLNNFGFTEYKPTKIGSETKYLCYYWYYNRHVDDNTASAVGPMEYGTVRNNIYKLAVNNIKRFGTFTPTDPDEWDVYFTLSVAIKNWVVRVNDKIEF